MESTSYQTAVNNEPARTVTQSCIYWGGVFLIAIPAMFIVIGFIVRAVLTAAN